MKISELIGWILFFLTLVFIGVEEVQRSHELVELRAGQEELAQGLATAGESTRKPDPHKNLKEAYHDYLEQELEAEISKVEGDPALTAEARNEANAKMQKFIRALSTKEPWAVNWRPK